MNSFFYHCPDLETFETLKFASDSTNTEYFTYSSTTAIFGEPDVKWDQICFVIDAGLIYARGKIFTNFNEILNELNFIKSELNNINLTLSSEYTYSSYTNGQLSLNSGDSFETAFGKLEKAIIDNEYVISSSLTYINENISYLSYNVDEDSKNMASGFVDLYDRMGILESTTASYINNYLNNVKDYEGGSKVELVRSNWNESNPLSYAYIENKPEIPTIPNLSKKSSGNGNAITNINVSGHEITYVKGSTFLTEHQSIKTINNQSIVGTGNVTLSGLPEVNSSYNGKILMVVNGQWAMISPSTIYSGSGIPNDINGNNGDIYIQTNS